jgi:DNA recombination protein RmuC
MAVLAWGAAVLLGATLVWVVTRELGRWIKDQISASLKVAQQDFLTLASQRLATERTQHLGDLDLRKTEVEKVVQGLEQQLATYQQLLREVEQDRATRYGSLEAQLTAAVSETQRLRQTTAQLTAMLGNAKVRGQWGEKTAEDILILSGLQEGIHYQKQKNTPLGRPDFTFFLPESHNCYMDVKFPLDNYIKLVNSESEEEQKTYKEQFLKDVRSHMKELEKRDYAPLNRSSPDYVLMFIPNEQVFGAINEWMPGLIDETLRKRIILCGPWTLYAQVRLIWQAWQNYYYAQTIGDITKTIQEFLRAYERFKERFEDMGTKLEDATQRYEEIARTSYAQLDRKIEQIEDYRKGRGIETPVTLEQEQAETLPMKEPMHD